MASFSNEDCLCCPMGLDACLLGGFEGGAGGLDVGFEGGAGGLGAGFEGGAGGLDAGFGGGARNL